MVGPRKWTDADAHLCAEQYALLRSVEKVSRVTGIPSMSVYRLLKRAGVRIQRPGEAHKGRPWTPARRRYSPAKPLRPDGSPRGYDILTARAIGNRSVSSHGYTVIRTGRKQRQYEHILVAEKALGRRLTRGEVVHHINCDRTDNRQENLLVCTIGYHLQLHARMRQHPHWQQFYQPHD